MKSKSIAEEIAGNKKSIPARIKRDGFICSLLAILIFNYATPVWGQAQTSFEKERAAAYAAFLQGHIGEATRLIKNLIPGAPTKAATADLQRDLIEVCITGYFPCYYEANQALFASIQSDKSLARLYPELMLYNFRERIWASDDKFIQKAIKDGGPAAYASPTLYPSAFAEMQLAMHAYYVRTNDLRSAERAISSAMLALFFVNPGQPYTICKILTGIFEALVSEQDIVGAYQFLSVIDPYVTKQLSHQSAVYAEYIQTVGDLFSYTTAYSVTAKTLTDAAGIFDKIDMAPEIRDFYLAGANSLGSAALALDQKLDEAKKLHARHPMQPHRLEIISRGSFQNLQEFYFAISDVFLSALENVPPDERWKPLFEKEPQWAGTDYLRPIVTAYRKFSLAGIELGRREHAKASQLFIEAARLRFDVFEKTQRASFEGFQLPSIVDKILITVALKFAAESRSSDAPDLMLRGSEVLLRNLRYSISDEAILLASQPDEHSRKNARAYINLVQQKKKWELDHLREWLDAPVSINKGALAGEYTSVVATLSKLKTQFVNGSAFEKANRLPTVNEIQDALSSNEVYITYFPTSSSFGRLCIGKTNSTYSFGLFDQTALNNARLLEFAVTANYAPNIQLDSQYPVEAAIYIRNLLFDGLGDCMKIGSNVVISLPQELASVPVAALLGDVPPRIGDGYDLEKAHWLIRDFSFSFVISAKQFLAVKARVPTAEAPLEYLGVGNPRLSDVDLAELRSAFSLRNNSNEDQGISRLKELPETADELKQVSFTFDPKKITVLTGDHASEEEFRTYALGDYDVIHFATHGVLDQGAKGLSESALIFTPGSSASDAFNDGILSASEISRLSLSARLVVLSACNSARYNQQQANLGVHDLHAAFTVAGTPTILAALWSVDSATSADLITHFFENWHQQASAAESLTQSIRHYLAHADSAHQHPRFWAPFEILGNGAIGDASKHGAAAVSKPTTFKTLDEFKSGGEILSAAVQDNDLILSLFAQWDGDRMAGILSKRDLSGREIWRDTSREIGAGEIAVSKNQIYALGYAGKAHFAPLIRSLNSRGETLWEKRFTDFEDYTFSGIAPDASGVVTVAYPSLHSDPSVDAYLVHIDATGDGIRKTSFKIDTVKIASPAHTALVRVKNEKTFIAINVGRDLRMDLKRKNILDFPSSCFEGGSVRLLEFDRDFELQKTIVIDHFQADTMEFENRELLLGGQKLDGCTLEGSAAIFKMSEDYSVKAFWQDGSIFPSTVRGIAVNEGITVLVNYQRAVGVNTAKPVDVQAKYDKRYGDDDKSIREASVIHLSNKGALLSRHDFSAGLSIIMDGLAVVNGKSAEYGTLGGMPALALP